MVSCVRNHSREAVAAPSRPRMATSRQHPPSFFVRTYREGLSRDISEGRRYYKRRQTPDTRTRHRSKRMQTFTIQHPQANTRDFSCARKQESMHNATPSSPLERDATEASPLAIMNATTRGATTNNCYYRDRHTYTDARTRHAISRGNRRYSTSYLPRNHARPCARTYTTRNDTQT